MDFEQRQSFAIIIGGSVDLILLFITGLPFFGYLGTSLIVTGVAHIALRWYDKWKKQLGIKEIDD